MPVKKKKKHITVKSEKKSRKKNSVRRNFFRGLIVLILLLFSGAAIIGYKYYKLIFISNVNLGDKETMYLYIPTGSDFNDVKSLLNKDSVVIDMDSFEWLCGKKNYTLEVKPGRYLLKNNMNNNELINLLRSGRQEPINLTINNIRIKQKLAGRVGKLLEADSSSLMEIMNNDSALAQYNLTAENVMCIFIPNTYDFFWNTQADKFIKRMYDEYQKFWNETRREKAVHMGLTPDEVVILASIVYQETRKKDEMSRVAGVYMNRINKGMFLQADPTVIFAIGDFNIRRVLTSQTLYDSPYNTYKYAGLPPGPICLPEPYVIDKVLDYEKHDYLYFCAKEDLSGYHNFAKTGAQHSQNAQKYHAALNRMKIKK